MDLVYCDGQFHLYATIKVPEDPPIEIKDLIGVTSGSSMWPPIRTASTPGDTIETTRRRTTTTASPIRSPAPRPPSAGSGR